MADAAKDLFGHTLFCSAGEKVNGKFITPFLLLKIQTPVCGNFSLQYFLFLVIYEKPAEWSGFKVDTLQSLGMLACFH